jgi:hypothetical protein
MVEPEVDPQANVVPTITRVRALFHNLLTDPNAFALPENSVRALIAFVVIGGMLWMQWHSPKEGAVPAALVSAAGLATGFYLTGSASATMKGLLSMLYVGAFVAFLLCFNWVPESINSQVTTVIGIYYGAKLLREDPAITPSS